MVSVSQSDLVVLFLRDQRVERAMEAVTTANIGDALDLSRERMAEWLELMTTLSALTEDGYVQDRTGVVGRDGEERNLYELTGAGERKAADCAERLEGERVTIDEDGVKREVSVDRLPAELPEFTLAEALARVRSDGTLYLSDDIEREFVGRRAERDRFRSYLSAVEAGDSRMVVVSGERDIGKTTLVETVLEEGNERGFDVLAGACESAVTEPYYPIREAFAACESTDIDDRSVFDHGRALLDDADEYAAQRAAFHAQLVEAVTGDQETPRVLFVDDIHLADHATIDFLDTLCSELDDERLVVVLTFTSEADLDDEYFLELFESHLEEFEHVELGPLTPEETRQLIEGVLEKRGAPDAFVDLVQEMTGGIPLYVEELVSQLREDGVVDPMVEAYPTTTAELDLPTGLREAIERRLNALDGPGRAVLEAAAVIGEHAEIEVLQAVTTTSPATLRDQLDLLVRTGFLRNHREGVRFVSTIFRETVLETAADARLERVHKRAAEALAAAHDDADEQLGLVARHYDHAGDPERALEFYRRAAERAREVYAHDEAVGYYTDALHIARDLPDCKTDVLSIVEAIGKVYGLCGDFEQVAKHFQYVLDHAEDPDRLRLAYGQLTRVELSLGHPEQAIEYAARGLAVDGPTPSPEVAWLLYHKASVLKHQIRYDEATTVFEEMRRLGEALDEPQITAAACRMIGWLRSQQGDQAGAIEQIERAIDLIERSGDEYGTVLMYQTLGSLHGRNGDQETAIRTHTRALELARELGATHTVKQITNNLGIAYERRGQWEDALACHEETLEIARNTSHREFESLGLSNSAWVLFHTETVEMARERYETALAISREIDEQYFVAYQLPRLGRVLLYAGSPEEAAEKTREARSIASECELTRELAVACGILGEIQRERGDLEAALDSFQRSLSLSRETGPIHQQLDGLAGYATTLLAVGRERAALEHAAEAISHPDREGNAFEGQRARLVEARCLRSVGAFELTERRLESLLETVRDGSNLLECETRIELGHLACDRGDPAGARSQFDAAHELATDIGAGLLADRCRDGLDRL